MKRRLIAAAAALVLGIVGAVLILNYVSGAEQRAAAGLQVTTVLVITSTVPQGTAAEDLQPYVAAKSVPLNTVAAGAVSDLQQITGQISTVALQVGEQVLRSRFVDPESVRAPGVVDIPAGMHQVTVLLEPHRVLGGNLSPGALVSIYATMGAPSQTTVALQSVQVSKVQGGLTPPQPTAPDAEADPDAEAPAETPAPPAAPPVPAGSILVTFVLSPADAQVLVYHAEHATLWLSLESVDGP